MFIITATGFNVKERQIFPKERVSGIFKHFIVSLLISAIMPALLLSTVQSPGKKTDTPAAQTLQMPIAPYPQIVVEHKPHREEEPIYIPVLQEDGSTRQMELESYVLGVVLGEMPASFELEALKAQAVAARTYALRSIQDQNHHGAVCMDHRCCQNYCAPEKYDQGEKYLQKAKSAVTQTAGMVATYQNRPICAAYFASSGGATEDAVAVWGTSVAYLQSVSSPENVAGAQAVTLTLTPAQFQQKMGGKIDGSPSQWFGKVTYTAGGGVKTMNIGGETYTGVQLRNRLGLRSTMFSVKVKGEKILITTSGHGHRVGMSQYGAQAMALAGSDYQKILHHYYQGITIEKYRPSGD